MHKSVMYLKILKTLLLSTIAFLNRVLICWDLMIGNSNIEYCSKIYRSLPNQKQIDAIFCHEEPLLYRGQVSFDIASFLCLGSFIFIWFNIVI